MPRNPYKRRCSYPGCRAWARRDSDPPYCAAHIHIADPDGDYPRPGAPPGNQNRLFHGFYSCTLLPDEFRDLDATSRYVTLEDEILASRVALRRTLAMLACGATLDDEPRPLDTQDQIRLLGLIHQGSRTVSRLVDVQRRHHLTNTELEDEIDAALDQLSEEWGIEL